MEEQLSHSLPCGTFFPVVKPLASPFGWRLRPEYRTVHLLPLTVAKPKPGTGWDQPKVHSTAPSDRYWDGLPLWRRRSPSIWSWDTLGRPFPQVVITKRPKRIHSQKGFTEGYHSFRDQTAPGGAQLYFTGWPRTWDDPIERLFLITFSSLAPKYSDKSQFSSGLCIG